MNKKSIENYEQNQRHLRDELAVQFLPAVKAMAFRLKERLPSSVDVMDLISIGTEEIIKLSRRYDEAINDSFWGYARQRVYGSMLDYLRSLDVLSRSNRKLVKTIDYEVSKYLNEHHEEPSDAYLATLLKEDISKIREARAAHEIYSILPLNEQLNVYNEETIDKKLEQDELLATIESILGGLTEREQQIIQLYYFDELNLKEISSILDITESRISQIHKAVIKKIRDKLGDNHG